MKQLSFQTIPIDIHKKRILQVDLKNISFNYFPKLSSNFHVPMLQNKSQIKFPLTCTEAPFPPKIGVRPFGCSAPI